MCCFGISMKCTGASGWMSWNASTSSSSYTFLRRDLAAHDLAENAVLHPLSMSPYCTAAARGRPAARSARLSGSRAAFSAMPGRALAPRELGQHVGGSKPVPREQHQAVEPQIGDFGRDAQFITVLRRHDRLGRLLADLLQDRVVALGEQRRDVGRRRIGRRGAMRWRAASAREDVAARRRGISHGRRSPAGPSAPARRRPSAVVRAAEEAALAAGVAGDAADLLDHEQDRVAVAIEPDLAHALHVARRFALAPQLAARARPVVRLAACPRCARAPRDSSTRASAPCPMRRPARSRRRGRRRPVHLSSQSMSGCGSRGAAECSPLRRSVKATRGMRGCDASAPRCRPRPSRPSPAPIVNSP